MNLSACNVKQAAEQMQQSIPPVLQACFFKRSREQVNRILLYAAVKMHVMLFWSIGAPRYCSLPLLLVAINTPERASALARSVDSSMPGKSRGCRAFIFQSVLQGLQKKRD